MSDKADARDPRLKQLVEFMKSDSGYSVDDLLNFNPPRRSDVLSRVRVLHDGKRVLLPEKVKVTGGSYSVEMLDELFKSHDHSILVHGESGTGKDVIAELVRTFDQNGNNYHAINCAGLSEYLADSELFGHVKGAFTGAVSNKEGLVAKAENGVLFLDEIGWLPKHVQAKLLRFMMTKEYRRLGEVESKEAKNVRIVAATNADIRETILHDLLYRFDHIVELPPLRDRGVDVLWFLGSPEFLGDSGVFSAISFSALVSILSTSWEGNVRSLQKFCKNRVLFHSLQPSENDKRNDWVFHEDYPGGSSDEWGDFARQILSCDFLGDGLKHLEERLQQSLPYELKTDTVIAVNGRKIKQSDFDQLKLLLVAIGDIATGRIPSLRRSVSDDERLLFPLKNLSEILFAEQSVSFDLNIIMPLAGIAELMERNDLHYGTSAQVAMDWAQLIVEIHNLVNWRAGCRDYKDDSGSDTVLDLDRTAPKTSGNGDGRSSCHDNMFERDLNPGVKSRLVHPSFKAWRKELMDVLWPDGMIPPTEFERLLAEAQPPLSNEQKLLCRLSHSGLTNDKISAHADVTVGCEETVRIHLNDIRDRYKELEPHIPKQTRGPKPRKSV